MTLIHELPSINDLKEQRMYVPAAQANAAPGFGALPGAANAALGPGAPNVGAGLPTEHVTAPQPVPLSPAGGAPMMPQPGAGAPRRGPDAASQAVEIIEKLQKQLNPPGKLYGANLFGMGEGIMGSGISPLSAVLFALGAWRTRKVPTAQAWQISMGLAQLPMQYEAAKKQAAGQVIQQAIGALNIEEKQQQMEMRERMQPMMEQAMQGSEFQVESFDPSTGRMTFKRNEPPMTLEQARIALHGVIPDDKLETAAHGLLAIPANMRVAWLNAMTGGAGSGEKVLNRADLTAFVESQGRVRGPSIPANMTAEDARATLKRMESAEQQRISIALGHLGLANQIGAMASHYVDPQTLRNPNPGMTKAELDAAVRAGQLVQVNPTDIGNIRDMKATVNSLLSMRERAQRLLSHYPGQNIVRAAQLAVRDRLATDADVRIFRGWSKALSLRLAADFNKGRPSDKDREAVEGIVFNPSDTVQTAVGKIDELIEHYNRVAIANLGVPLVAGGGSRSVNTPPPGARVRSFQELTHGAR